MTDDVLDEGFFQAPEDVHYFEFQGGKQLVICVFHRSKTNDLVSDIQSLFSEFKPPDFCNLTE